MSAFLYSYGIALDNDGSSDNGYMKCKVAGTFIGEYCRN